MPEYVLAQVIGTLAMVLDQLLWFYNLIVIVAVLITWVNADPRNPIVQFLYSVTEPVLSWIRRRFPFVIVGRLDLSPIALLVAIFFARRVLVSSLYVLAMRIERAAA
jgi:YggT family protein